MLLFFFVCVVVVVDVAVAVVVRCAQAKICDRSRTFITLVNCLFLNLFLSVWMAVYLFVAKTRLSSVWIHKHKRCALHLMFFIHHIAGNGQRRGDTYIHSITIIPDRSIGAKDGRIHKNLRFAG